jgi:MSHA biogenesis protein MshO
MAMPANARLLPRRCEHGMTLIELVVTISVSTVVVAFMALFIVTPMQAYSAQARRADLVDAADGALRMMGRDLRAALPNSVRVASAGSSTALELLLTLDGARYRDNGPLGNPATELDLTAADGAFATTVPFTQLTLPWSSSSAYLAIYNIGVPGADAWQGANVITPAGTSITVAAGSAANEHLVTLSPAFHFAFGSPARRVYLVEGPVTYLCDTASGTLRRYSGYALAASERTSDAALMAAGASRALVAGDVAGCQFSYASGSAQRNALATLGLTLTRSSETIQLLNEAQLVNTP